MTRVSDSEPAAGDRRKDFEAEAKVIYHGVRTTWTQFELN